MQTYTIAVAGKGGVGKTTTCGMIIDYLSKAGKGPILVVDADANSNLNEVLGVEVETTLGDIREEMAHAEATGSLPANMKGEIQDKLPEWNVVVGTREAVEVVKYLKDGEHIKAAEAAAAAKKPKEEKKEVADANAPLDFAKIAASIPAIQVVDMTDESVDRFYTCILCQSFAPAHCCVITPERLGLCGAVSWLDAKASYELNPNGPSQPILKEDCLDERTGRYGTVNEAVKEATHGAVESVTLYSILEDPMTSCGCFECICGIEPTSNGFIVVNREYKGMQLLLWAGDEEFAPSAQVLYSDNFSAAFAAEDRVVAGDILISAVRKHLS